MINNIQSHIQFTANNKIKENNKNQHFELLKNNLSVTNDLQNLTYNQLLIKKNYLSFHGAKRQASLIILKNLNVADKEELISSLNKAMQKMLNAAKKLDSSSKSQAYNIDETKKFIKGGLLSSEIANFLNMLVKNGGPLPYVSKLFENFDRYLAITAPNVAISNSQKEKLRANYNLWVNRKLISNSTVEILDHVSNIQQLEPYKKEIKKVKELIAEKIGYYGLSPEIQDIVRKSRQELGIKIDLPDSPELAKEIYNRLSLYKKSGYPLTHKIKFNDFDPFFGPGRGIALYERHKKFKLTDKRTIYYNPILLNQSLESGNYSEIYKTVKHELGHFWHNKKIGDAKYDELSVKKVSCILSPEEIKILKKFENLSEKVHIEKVKAEYFYLVDMRKLIFIMNNKNRLGFNISDRKIVDEAKPVLRKLIKTRNLIKEAFADNPIAMNGALINPNETVAVAIEESKYTEYSAEFKKYLKQLGMPEIKV